MREKFFSVAFVLFLFAATPVIAGEDQQDLSADLTIEDIQVVIQLEYIQLSFLVRDSKGDLIRNLASEDFVLFEDGKPRKIAALREREVPISAVVMVDTSWSIGTNLHNAVQTAVDFFKGLEQERSALVLFSERPRLVLDWDARPSDVTPLLEDVRTDGKTALYESVIWVVDNLFEQSSGKKLIILITDGIDTVSDKSFEEMMKASRRKGVTLYPIVYSNSVLEQYRRRLGNPWLFRKKMVSPVFHNLMVLQNQFVESTLRYGGRTIFSNNFADLKDIYSDIIAEMKSHYLLLYESNGDENSERRDVKVYPRRVPGKIFIEVSQ